MTVPNPRTPVCMRHHVHLASCQDCAAQRTAERRAAALRLERIRREGSAL